MEKLKRNDRLVVMSTLLTKNPNTLFSLTDLVALTGAAKSTVSEDLTIVKEVLTKFNLGRLSSVAGASGGVFYRPVVFKDEMMSFLNELSVKLSDPERVIPGGFIYTIDLIFDPRIISRIGEIFYTKFKDTFPDYIVTMETKGIPIAMNTARSFNIPLVIIRDSGRVTEGSSVNINYLSRSSRRIQTMSLSRRALPAKSKVLIIDDFMKGGGTAQGMHNLMKEFDAEVVGTGVMIATREPQEKLIKEYIALLELILIDEVKMNVLIKPF